MAAEFLPMEELNKSEKKSVASEGGPGEKRFSDW
jgi:hypothetical protein